MTISAAEIYLLNHMNATAAKCQLGTLIANAEAIVASEIALANGAILAGNGSGIAAAVTPSGDVTMTNGGVFAIGAKKVLAAMTAIADGKIFIGGASGAAAEQTLSGDVTVTNAGVTAIGAAKVTEAMLVLPSTVGLQTQRRAYGVFNPTAVSGDRTIAAHALAATIPINAFVTGAWYWVETTATSATDAGTIALSIEGANDEVTAIAISNGGNPWDTTSKPVECTTVIETTSTWVKTTAARALTATVAVEALTGGKVHFWADYIVFG